MCRGKYTTQRTVNILALFEVIDQVNSHSIGGQSLNVFIVLSRPEYVKHRGRELVALTKDDVYDDDEVSSDVGSLIYNDSFSSSDDSLLYEDDFSVSSGSYVEVVGNGTCDDCDVGNNIDSSFMSHSNELHYNGNINGGPSGDPCKVHDDKIDFLNSVQNLSPLLTHKFSLRARCRVDPVNSPSSRDNEQEWKECNGENGNVRPKPLSPGKYPLPQCMLLYNAVRISDALTSFSNYDPEADLRNKEVERATERLIREVIPALAAKLTEMTPYEISNLDVSVYFHSHGVNMRHLGLVRSHILPSHTSNPVRTVLLLQIVTRTLKNIARDYQRRWMKCEQSTSEMGLKLLLTQFINLVVGSNPNSEDFWTENVVVGIIQRFGSCAIDNNIEHLHRVRMMPDFLKVLYFYQFTNCFFTSSFPLL